jgi:hypothetical protein
MRKLSLLPLGCATLALAGAIGAAAGVGGAVASGGLVELAALTASDGSPSAAFGSAVAVSGDTVVVGAPQAGPGGALYVFVRRGTGWSDATETAKLTVADAGSADRLGSSVAIDGDTIVAGAPGAENGRGAVYVFLKTPGGWQTGAQRIQLAASDAAAGWHLGQSVAISGSTVLAGAPGARVGTNPGQGEADIFLRPPSGWTSALETARLSASDGKAFDQLGSTVALSATTAVASGAGAEYLFTQPTNGWTTTSTQTAKLTAPARLGPVAIDHDTIAAGAPTAHGGQGAIEVYLNPPGGWSDRTAPDAELTASDATAGQELGSALALSGPTIAAGNTGGGNIGAAYIFTQPPTGWTSQHENTKLTAPGGGTFEDFFAQALATDGTTIQATAGNSTTYIYGPSDGGPPPPKTLGDPTTPPHYTAARGPLPGGSAARPAVISARVTPIGSLLLLRPRAHTISVVLLCPARRGSRCVVRGVLSVLIAHRRMVLGSLSLTIPSQRATAVAVHLRLPAGGVRPAGLSGTLRLISSAPGLGQVTANVPVIVRPAAPGKPPSVTTEAASGVSPPGVSGGGAPAGVTLAGTVNPEGRSTRYRFELGPGAGTYDVVLPTAGADAGDDQLTHLVTARASGLLAGVLYHYRLVAESASGTAYSADRSFTVPLVFGNVLGAPLGDVTEAGPVSLLLSYVCVPDPPPIVTGATIQCVVTATNPQPATVPFGRDVVAVRAARVILNALAAPGTIAADTLGPNVAIVLTIPPGGTVAQSVTFKVEHPPPLMSFVLVQANGPPAMATLAPAQPRVRVSVSCANERRGKPRGRAHRRSVVCTITTTNSGQDAADFTSFEVRPSAGLTNPRTIAGRPPAVLGADASTQTSVSLDLAPSGAPATVTVVVSGLDETDRLPFLATASAGAPPAS